MTDTDNQHIDLMVKGQRHTGTVEPRTSLADHLRENLDLTGTHVGCEQGCCGACTVLLDGEAVFSCLLLAVQASGHEVTTVEGLAPRGKPHRLQDAFRRSHALQCGFCTPGFLLTVLSLLAESPDPTDTEIRQALSGNVCRCTGYQQIIDAVRLAAHDPGQDVQPTTHHAKEDSGPAPPRTGEEAPPAADHAEQETPSETDDAEQETPSATDDVERRTRPAADGGGQKAHPTADDSEEARSTADDAEEKVASAAGGVGEEGRSTACGLGEEDGRP
jgi:carbon-monoxide dehydrogenase small subunit